MCPNCREFLAIATLPLCLGIRVCLCLYKLVFVFLLFVVCDHPSLRCFLKQGVQIAPSSCQLPLCRFLHAFLPPSASYAYFLPPSVSYAYCHRQFATHTYFYFWTFERLLPKLFLQRRSKRIFGINGRRERGERFLTSDKCKIMFVTNKRKV